MAESGREAPTPSLLRVVNREPTTGWLMLTSEDCPLKGQHTAMPGSAFGFDALAEHLAETHKQMRCEGCHRWVVWVPYGGEIILNGIETFVLAKAVDAV